MKFGAAWAAPFFLRYGNAVENDFEGFKAVRARAVCVWSFGNWNSGFSRFGERRSGNLGEAGSAREFPAAVRGTRCPQKAVRSPGRRAICRPSALPALLEARNFFETWRPSPKFLRRNLRSAKSEPRAAAGPNAVFSGREFPHGGLLWKAASSLGSGRAAPWFGERRAGGNALVFAVSEMPLRNWQTLLPAVR